MAVWDVAGNQLVARFGDLPTSIDCVAFSPDAASVVEETTEGKLYLWHMGQTKPAWKAVISTDNTKTFTLQFSRDGNRLMAAGNSIWILDPKLGRPILSFGGKSEGYLTMRINEDGKNIIAGTWDQVLAWELP